MRKSKITDVDVEKKMTAGVRHAKVFATVVAVLLIALAIYSDLNHMSNAAFQAAMLACVALLARWLFDGLESIISLLCSLNTAPSTGTKFPDAAFPQRPAPTSAPQQPMNHDDPAHWPKQEPMQTGIDVAAALRAAKELNRN